MLTGYYPQKLETNAGSNNEIASRNRQMNSSMYKGQPTSVLISASSSRMFTSYEISDEIARAKVQVSSVTIPLLEFRK